MEARHDTRPGKLRPLARGLALTSCASLTSPFAAATHKTAPREPRQLQAWPMALALALRAYAIRFGRTVLP